MIKLEEPRFTEDEVGQTVRWLNDPVLMKYSEQRHHEHTVKSQLKFIHDFKAPDRYRKITCDGHYIGSLTAYVDIHNLVADVGILVGPGHSGLGHGTEAWRLFLQELRGQGVRKAEAGCMSLNGPMLRICEKNHMRLEGCRRHHFDLGEGKFADLVMYGTLL